MMPGDIHDGMQCQEFEALLSDALDGTLSPPATQRFHAHRDSCQNCGPLFAIAQAGMNWLDALPEVEPPRNLVHNILVATTGAEERARAAAAPMRTLGERLRDWLRPVYAPVFGVVRQPRFALTFAMAFFSISVVLNAVGVRITDLRHADLRPSAVRRSVLRGYYESSARVVRYYENIRLFQQFEAQVRDLKQATRPAPDQPQPEERQERKLRNNDTSGQPTNQNYSRDTEDSTLASSHGRQPLDPTLTVPRRSV